jgi:primosomal protein N' (replication factor Y)
MKVAKIVLDLSLDREFDYLIPDALLGQVHVGSRVLVPFGRGSGERAGYVMRLAASSTFPTLKSIIRLDGEKKQIPPKLIDLAQWMADYYCCAREQTVLAVLPAAVRSGKVQHKQRKFVSLVPTIDLATELTKLEKRSPKQALALQLLNHRGECQIARLERETGIGRDALKRLEQKGLVTICEQVVERDPFADDEILPTTPLDLTPDQARVLPLIHKSVEARDGEIFLLHGVTGSGKTEVYLQAIANCLELGREAIVLVPEIALTPQTVERFRGRFGETVSVLHSGLSDGERFDEWIKIHEGQTRIVVGARSALFAPFRNLGLIVVDEEHETTYKQDEMPRYNARDIAVVRGKQEKATVILGSATPSLETYYNCFRKKYRLLELPCRVDNYRMPHMELVDMRAEAALQGGNQIFSRRLQELIRDRLNCGEQTILFLNRRGYATQMMCTKCGHVATCEACDLAYTYHRQEQSLICHLCGDLKRAPQRCPQCGDEAIRYSGLGTEKIEYVIQKLFPSATVDRMDSDTMTRKDSYRKALNAFRSGRTHILIGTQMIAKGLHFPNVTLVGVIFADLGLHIPDFRAGERTFQLLTQVAGRAGRGDSAGHVIVQSYTPFHPALQHALEHDFKGFYEQEIEMREILNFPPASHMAMVHFRGEQEDKTAAAAKDFAERLRPLLSPETTLSNPAPSPMAKIRRQYRYQLSLRGGNIVALSRTLRQLVVGVPKIKGVSIAVDIDPQSLM